jgi:hypothetical protein
MAGFERRSPIFPLVAVMLLMSAVSVDAQGSPAPTPSTSPSPAPSGVATSSPSASGIATPAPSASAMASGSNTPLPSVLPIGELTWGRPVELVKHTRAALALNNVTNLPDGRVAIIGIIGANARSQPGAAVWTSADGKTWAREGLKGEPGSTALDVAMLDDGTLVVVGLTATQTPVEWMGSGDTWSDPMPLDGLIQDLEISDGLLVGTGADLALLQHGVGQAMAFTSTDGVTWTPAPLAEKGLGAKVLHGLNGTWVVAGTVEDAPTAWTSPDATTWTQVPLNLEEGLWYLTASASAPWGFTIAGALSTSNGFVAHVLTSPDGATWSDVFQDPTQPLTAALGSGDEVLLFGSTAIVRASDPLSWVATKAPFGGYNIVGAGRLPDGPVVLGGSPSAGQPIRAPIWISAPAS